MKTTILVAAALFALPFGAVASPVAKAGSVIAAEEAEAEVIDLEVKNMR